MLVIGDDHGWPYYGFMGHEIAKTPHLDALVRESVLFPYGFTTASTCRPALMSLLTGLSPVQWKSEVLALRARGVRRKAYSEIEDFETLPRLLGQAGYASFQAGKHWEGSFELSGFTDGMKGPVSKESIQKWGLLQARAGGDSLVFGRETMEPLWDFLDAKGDRPFFVWFAPKLPHTPHDAPQRYLDLYPESELSEQSRAYYANVTRFDAAVGALLAQLGERGLREKTLVVYVSDNGWQQDPRDAWPIEPIGGPDGKLSIRELGVRTPVIFHWPGRIGDGREIDDPVSTLDVFATLLDLAGVPLPADRHGESLLGTLLDDRPFDRDPVIGTTTELRPPAAANDQRPRSERAAFARDRTWRYVWYRDAAKYGDRPEAELYRIDSDPRERSDVIAEHPEVAARLRAEIEAYLFEMAQLVPADAVVPLDIRYASTENFVGAPVDDYDAPRCLLTRSAVEALLAVQTDLQERDLSLLVFDCYRSQRAVDHFVRWAADGKDLRTRNEYYPRVPKGELFEKGYISEQSSHTLGATVDVTLTRGRGGDPLDMGTPFDFFDPRSHTESDEIGEGAGANRLLLREAMERRGFRNYPNEWWHYTLGAP